MVERKVSFGIDLAPGVSQLRTQLQSVTQIAKSELLKMEHAKEQHNLRIRRLDDKMAQYEKDITHKGVQAYQSALQAKERAAESFNLRMKQMMERAQLQSAGGGGMNLSSVGHLAQAAGFYRVGHLARAANMFGIGSQMGGGAAAGLAGIGAAALPLAAAFGAVLVASKLVEVGFNAVAHTATEIVGAISQIGGARGLQDMLVESSSTERMAAEIASNVTEKITTRQVMDVINAQSSKTEFTPGQIGSMLSAYKGKTGDITSLTNLGTFGADLASVSGMGPEATGALLGQLRAQFGLSGLGLKQAAIGLWGQGRAGTVELKNAESISQALSFSRAAGGGNLQAGMGLEMGAVQLAQKGIGGTSADEAVTSIRRLQEDLMHKPGQIQSIIGGGAIGGQDQQGNFVFNNLSNTLARLSLAELQNRVPQKMIDERAARAPRAIGEYVAQTPEFKQATSDKERIKVIEDNIKALSSADMAIDEFDGALKKVKDTVDYQFKQAFNDVSVQLEGVFLPVLKELIPVLKNFANELTAHKDEIGEMFREFVTGLIMVANALPDLAIGLMGLSKWLLSFLPNSGDKIKEYQSTVDFLEKNKKNWDTMPHRKEDSLDALNKNLDEANGNLAMWKGIKKIEDMNVDDMKARAKRKADDLIPPTPDVVSGADKQNNTASHKKLDTNNKHLSDMLTLQQKQLQVLLDISRTNTVRAASPERIKH